PVQPADGELASIFGEGLVRFAWFDGLGAAARRLAAEHHQIQQRVRAEPVRAVHRDARRLANRHQARHDRIGLTVLERDDLAVIVRRDPAHVVVDRGQHRDRLLRDIHAGEDLGRLGDARQALVDAVRAKMLQVQIDVILVRADAAAFADLDRHRAADDVARSEVLGVRSVALHEALALRVSQNAALAAHALRDQATGAVYAGRLELYELHVLQRQPGAQHHSAAVAGASVRRGAGDA